MRTRPWRPSCASRPRRSRPPAKRWPPSAPNRGACATASRSCRRPGAPGPPAKRRPPGRAESGRLRTRFAQLQEAGRRGGSGAAAAASTPSEPRVSRRASSRSAGQEPATAPPQTPARDAPRRRTRQREADPTETRPFDVLGLQDELELAAPAPPPSRRATRQTPEPSGWTPPVADRMRPVNPSLRHRTWWFGRLLALIVLCGVIAAVYLGLHSTVLH